MAGSGTGVGAPLPPEVLAALKRELPELTLIGGAFALLMLDLFLDNSRRFITHGIALVVSLHQVDYATAYFDRVIAMNGGRVVFDGPSSQINAAFLTELYGASAEELILPSQFAVPAPNAASAEIQTVS